MIRFINVYKGSLSVPYTTLEKAEAQKPSEVATRVLRVHDNGLIEDITDTYHEIIGAYHA